jgi:hypothetical protein
VPYCARHWRLSRPGTGPVPRAWQEPGPALAASRGRLSGSRR